MKKAWKRMLLVMLAGLLLCAAIPSSVLAYQNPFEFSYHENYGDPYILKHNGVYYQYANGIDPVSEAKGVKMWHSRDLINWEYYGVVTDLSEEHLAAGGLYAPEVRYLDGKFYIYSAPGGEGHYIYVSDSPYGPFTVATENLGRKFDGNVMMDSDNTLYFVSPYQSGDGNLRLETMVDPLTFSDGRVYTLSNTVGGDRWTEGPTMFKRLGMYYMTYTGNHVWEKSYRVEYALTSNPTKGWTEPADGTILLDIEGELNGMGHNSIFIGPDLDTYYITYHNLHSATGRTNVKRRGNYNRIVWNGEKMIVQGPTAWDIDDPDLPDFYEYFDSDAMPGMTAEGSWTVADNFVSASSGTLLSKASTADVFTAEYNIKGKGSVLFGYTDAQNYGRVWIDEAAKAFKAEIVKDGAVVWSVENALHSYFDYTKLHTIRVQQTEDTLRILLNDVERILEEKSGLTGGKIGYRADGAMSASFTAFSHKALGSADHENYAPIPGVIAGIHYTNTEAALQTVKAADEKMGYALKLAANDTATYNVHVRNENTYSIALTVANVTANTKLEVLVDGQVAATVTLPEVSGEAYRTLAIRNLKLPEGKRQLSFRVVEGGMELYEIEGSRDAEGTTVVTDCDTKYDQDGMVPWKVFESTPSWGNGTMNYSVTGTPKYAKALAGNLTDGDYIVEADIRITGTSGSAGLLFRVENADNGHNPDCLVTNPTYHQGYNLALSKGMISIAKQNFGENKQLAVAMLSDLVYGETYRVKVEVINDTFTVYIDGEKVLEYTDTNCPYMTGRAGVRVNNTKASYDNFSITPVTDGLEVVHNEVTYGTGKPVAYTDLSESGSHTPSVSDEGAEGDQPSSDPNGSDDGNGDSDGADTANGSDGGMTVVIVAVAAVVVAAIVVAVILMMKKKKTAQPKDN